jgi:hypothetical protein
MGLKDSRPLEVSAFAEILALRNPAGDPYVLIGGQAVNYWAEKYRSVEPELQKLMPFTSLDIDFYGTRDDVTTIAQQLNRKPEYPTKRGFTALAGMIPVKVGDCDSAVEVVRVMPGLKKKDIKAVLLDSGGARVLVLNPISLAINKLELLFRISQEKRQDARHLHMLVYCVRGFLRDLIGFVGEDPSKGKAWTSAVNRMWKVATSKHGVVRPLKSVFL